MACWQMGPGTAAPGAAPPVGATPSCATQRLLWNTASERARVAEPSAAHALHAWPGRRQRGKPQDLSSALHPPQHLP